MWLWTYISGTMDMNSARRASSLQKGSTLPGSCRSSTWPHHHDPNRRSAVMGMLPNFSSSTRREPRSWHSLGRGTLDASTERCEAWVTPVLYLCRRLCMPRSLCKVSLIDGPRNPRLMHCGILLSVWPCNLRGSRNGVKTRLRFTLL